jgi:hypothetical protein
MVQSFYSGFINQPRSKLRLPVKELIKTITQSDVKPPLENISNDALILQSNAEQLLDALRSKNMDSIPRLESVNEITRELATHGQWEKAESLILNMKTDCNITFIIYS